MSETGRSAVYFNGKLVTRASAKLDIEDRAALFGDGVYEVIRCYRGQPLEMEGHLRRLQRSLHEIYLLEPPDIVKMPQITDRLVRELGVDDVTVYWQVSRGAAPREINYEKLGPLRPTVLAIARPAERWRVGMPVPTVKAISHDDLRWHRCDIKTLMLLPAVLAVAEAQRKGAQVAIFHRDNRVTEANSSNVAIVRDGEIWTPPADQWILPGITRMLAVKVAADAGLVVHERPFELQKLKTADEVMIMGTTSHIAAVTEIDGHTIGNGAVGPVTHEVSDLLMAYIDRVCPKREG